MPLARKIADALRRGATVVAATPRTARALHLRFAEDQRAAGHSLWPSPAIRDWDSWLRDLWRDHAFATANAPLLLTALQEQTLWTRIQRNDHTPVVSPETMAALAMDAWSLLSAFNAHTTRRDSWDQPDAERFRRWAAEFHRTCTRQGWLSASQLETTLAPLLQDADHLSLPPEILLVGFDRLTPAQDAFLSALGARLAIDTFTPEPLESSRAWIATPDRRDEIAACAAWARDRVLENPAARIGIIAPAVSADRGAIDRTFRHVLLPASEDIRRPSSLLPWEFSLGQPLADVPAIQAALLLLRWIAQPIQEEQVSWLMLSGFVADTDTFHAALAAHDARQRRYGLLSPERSLAAFRDSLRRNPALRPLEDQLYQFVRAVQSNHVLGAPHPPSAWTEIVQILLGRISWPGPRPADSVQFQAIERWHRLLDEISLLDFDGARPDYSDFLSLLERQARDTIFAPVSHDAPIQIMGPFESAGQRFDALWFLGADDASWPMRGRLHPLLPPSVQRQFALPHSTPEDDWNLAHIVTTRLLHSASRLVFSYATRDKDSELRPSPLIASLFPSGTTPQYAAYPEPALESNARTEPIPDGAQLPWSAEQNAGGASVLKAQAACPFQAFAARRLRAEPLDETEWGLSPSVKGQLLHRVMQRLFSPSESASLRTRDDIVTAIDTKSLSGILETHIDAALREQFVPLPSDPWQQACLAAEKRRLLIRIDEWLRLEAGRQPFTVQDCEKTLPDIHIGDLRLKLRADRIDLLPDGSHLLLDYKTGPVTPANWRGPRPRDPQLPLYAAYGNVENVSGILFAQIRAGESGFTGRIRDAQSQLKANIGSQSALVTDPYTDSMRDQWADALRNLAAEFLRGEAAVDPLPHACDTCHFQSLCRVAELNLVSADPDAEDAND